MPILRCREMGKPGYSCGKSGFCYTYTAGNETGRKRAKQKAINQCLAMDEPISESDLKDAATTDSSRHPEDKKKKKKKKRSFINADLQAYKNHIYKSNRAFIDPAGSNIDYTKDVL